MQHNPRLDIAQRNTTNVVGVDLFTDNLSQTFDQSATFLFGQLVEHADRFRLNDFLEKSETLVDNFFPFIVIDIDSMPIGNRLMETLLRPHETLFPINEPE